MIDLLSGFFSVLVGFYLSLVNSEHRVATACAERSGVSYCFYQGDAPSSATIYFLHGFGNDEESWGWNSVTKRIEEEWKANKTLRPTVVTLSFGKIWWYNKDRGEKLVSLLKDIEKEKGIAHHRRILYGDSMGAHNSFRLAADYPSYFERLALICPAMPKSFTETLSEETPGLWPVNWSAEKTIQNIYSSLDEKERNPLRNSRYLNQLKSIKNVHVIISRKDHFGFYPGGLALYRALKENTDSKIELEEQDIVHCEADAKVLATFLLGPTILKKEKVL